MTPRGQFLMSFDTRTLLPRRDVVSAMTWLPYGPMAGLTYGDTGTLVAGYDSSYRLTGLDDTRATVALRDVAYGWTTRDDLASVTDNLTPALTETYGYDARQMLSGADGPWGALFWLYDGVGNRTNQTLISGGTVTDSYSYPSLSNRLSSIALGAGGTRTLTHDAAGNVTGDSQPGTAYAYTYDAAGRMATVSLNGVQQGEYQYSATGQQVVRRLVPSNVTIHNIFDSAGNRIAEYQFNPTTGVSARLP